jgi:DNA polymerase I-like protein with 3'-5' exonuclease and polymerase domains
MRQAGANGRNSVIQHRRVAVKRAMVDLDADLRAAGPAVRMILWSHDELVRSCTR